ncbi:MULTISPECIES: Tn3 family transposase [unclassified Streptomyces]|uniref:Tn3 family transposase n=1 Tax=unclassified Streptomyces TaxID=2593676 RepID=UPI00136F6CAB|nr:Tn3 family transposase [Streptomyces sp. LamerLS-316]MYQ40715.1 Tn3 family transposase [Streptomyces sp. SID4921]
MEDLARSRVNLNKVITHWPDMLRVAGSLVTNQVRAYEPAADVRPRRAPDAARSGVAEYGRIAKTEHLLRVVGPVDDTYRRQMNRQLSTGSPRFLVGQLAPVVKRWRDQAVSASALFRRSA